MLSHFSADLTLHPPAVPLAARHALAEVLHSGDGGVAGAQLGVGHDISQMYTMMMRIQPSNLTVHFFVHFS